MSLGLRSGSCRVGAFETPSEPRSGSRSSRPSLRRPTRDAGLQRLLGVSKERLGLIAGLGEPLASSGPSSACPSASRTISRPRRRGARASLDPDLLLVPRPGILSRDVDDPVRVDVERHVDLRHTPRRRGMPTSWNFPSVLLERRHLRLALEDVDLDGGLVVLGGCGPSLPFVGIDVLRLMSRVKTPPRVSIPSERGVTPRRRMSFTRREDARLDRGADGDDLVRVHALVGSSRRFFTFSCTAAWRVGRRRSWPTWSSGVPVFRACFSGRWSGRPDRPTAAQLGLSLIVQVLGPSCVAVTNAGFDYRSSVESSIAFSAAS